MKRAPLSPHELGSDNVFDDLGLSQPGERLARAQLALRITRLLDERGLTQEEAARLLGTRQPKVSLLRRGRLDGFSLERLIRFLNALDQDVRIRVHAAPPSRVGGNVRVEGVRPPPVARGRRGT